jgi:hypothetical protein
MTELVIVTGVTTVFTKNNTPPLPKLVVYVEYILEISKLSKVISLSIP